ncbi:hypothetical protein GCM10009118_34300 [Wandonia haliotis]|uniref:RHS repeat-associated core domain-containing protein n=1 Tax=Wandonia haliotis TaxID=574963 RepID=A0ABP3Y8B3_9FLAO
MGDKRYELSNHLGNVLATISDRKLPEFDLGEGLAYYKPDVVSYSDYMPFGMQMAERNGSAGDYRYGFNGKEMDNEVLGNGNQYDYGFRIYNPRIAKFLSVDPLTASYPWYTPYQFAGNMPIQAIDLDGLEEYLVNRTYISDGNHGYYVQIRVVYVLPKNQRKGTEPGSYDLTNNIGEISTTVQNKKIQSGSVESIIVNKKIEGKYLKEGTSNVGYTLKSSVEANDGEYMTSTFTDDIWSALSNKEEENEVFYQKIPIPHIIPSIITYEPSDKGDHFSTNRGGGSKEESAIISATNNLLEIDDLNLNIKVSFKEGMTIDDAQKQANEIKQKIITLAKSKTDDKSVIENLEKRIGITESNPNPQSRARVSITYELPKEK